MQSKYAASTAIGPVGLPPANRLAVLINAISRRLPYVAGWRLFLGFLKNLPLLIRIFW
jgi:hypothetical protein